MNSLKKPNRINSLILVGLIVFNLILLSMQQLTA
jgi:hypothetical protein